MERSAGRMFYNAFIFPDSLLFATLFRERQLS